MPNDITPRGRWDIPAQKWVEPSECPVPAQEPFKDDATAHYDRTDPGQSVPGECVHDFFTIGRGKFRCRWCGTILGPYEP